ncbi:MAG: hypothetical protein KIS76_02290 [Pyrinomonadaceae bacterium]|nr:hypothetical protein [Pyrinomonadaceae bacterium]
MGVFKKKKPASQSENVWARPKMFVTFRASVMPGKTTEERTFQIEEVLANGRVRLSGFIGEHKETAFEPVNFLRGR